MTASDVLFDTWAWWEVLFATPTGARLAQRYIDDPAVRVHTSAITFGELAAKFDVIGASHKTDSAATALHAHSDVHDLSADLALAAGRLRQALRKNSPDASLGDAIVLATARSLGAFLVSGDSDFKGEPDVVHE